MEVGSLSYKWSLQFAQFEVCNIEVLVNLIINLTTDTLRRVKNTTANYMGEKKLVEKKNNLESDEHELKKKVRPCETCEKNKF